MKTTERTQAAARIITKHRLVKEFAGALCYCGKDWTPLHVAEMLDKAGLLCTRAAS